MRKPLPSLTMSSPGAARPSFESPGGPQGLSTCRACPSGSSLTWTKRGCGTNKPLQLGTRAGFAMAEIQSGIDQVFLDLLEYQPGRAGPRMPKLIEQAEAAKGWHQWLIRGRLAEAAAEIALAKGGLGSRGVGGVPGHQRGHRRVTTNTEDGSPAGAGKSPAAVEGARPGGSGASAALAGAERLTHPPTLWRAWWSLSQALARSGDDRRGRSIRKGRWHPSSVRRAPGA